MQSRPLHVAPGESAAGSLRQALRMLRVEADVVGFPDTMSAGPIAEINDQQRINWLLQNFYGTYRTYGDPSLASADHLAYLEEYVPKFWQKLHLGARDIFIWFSRRCASDIAFLFEVTRRLNSHENVFLVDLTDLRDSDGRRITKTSYANPELLESFWSKRESLSVSDCISAKEFWATLCLENAPLRVLHCGELVSAPLEYFDERLKASLPQKFQKVSRVVGNALGFIDSTDEYSQGFGDLFYFRRLRLLAERGEAEWVGVADNMRLAEIRCR